MARSATAVAKLALLLNSAIKHLRQALPTALHYVHVDDISTTFLCDRYEELEDQATIAGKVHKREVQDKAVLLFAPEKTFVLASCDKVARIVQKAAKNMGGRLLQAQSRNWVRTISSDLELGSART